MADPVKIYFHFKPTPSGDVTAIKELHEHFMRKSAGATFGCIIIPNNQANPVTPLVIVSNVKNLNNLYEEADFDFEHGKNVATQ